MGRNRFVDPRTKKLELSDGDWIEVKAQLTFGESERMKAAAVQKKFKLDEDGGVELKDIEITIDQVKLAKLAAWIVDWSFCDGSGAVVSVSPDAIEALDSDSAEEVNAALDKHIEEMSKNSKATS